LTRRTYDQYCPIATALDVVGERWSLLILRELLLGPRRYRDLREALPGMWTNLLADRLTHLERHEIIHRVELPGRTVYELTDDGCRLEPVLLDLGAWGLGRLGSPAPDEPVPSSAAVLAGLRAWFRADLAGESHEVYGARVGDLDVALEVTGGQLRIRPAGSTTPKVRLVADPAALLALRRGELRVEEAERSGQLRFEGPRSGVARFRRLFQLGRRAAR
jgi:DNA-binding HxlR family transcriptional regulator